jgi:hypothetical protein
MSKNKFIQLEAVENILESKSFFGYVAKRNKKANRILYTYRSAKYYNVTISVLTMRLDPTNVLSDKIVLGIKFDDTEINGWNGFINKLKEITAYKPSKRK